MKLPPAAPAKTPSERAKANSNMQDIPGSGQSQAAKAPQSHSSSFITDQKQPSRDQKEDASKNVSIPADEEGDDQSVTMTTFHNVTGVVDGAFKEEENEPGLSQSINLNNALNQTSRKFNLKSPQDLDDKGQTKVEREGSPANQNRQNQSRCQDRGVAGANKPVPDEENDNDHPAPKVLANKVNDFDLSKMEAEDGAPSDSEQ